MFLSNFGLYFSLISSDKIERFKYIGYIPMTMATQIDDANTINLKRFMDTCAVRYVVDCQPRDKKNGRINGFKQLLGTLGYDTSAIDRMGSTYYAVMGMVHETSPTPGVQFFGPHYDPNKVYFTNLEQLVRIGETFDGTKSPLQHMESVGVSPLKPKTGFNTVSLVDSVG